MGFSFNLCEYSHLFEAFDLHNVSQRDMKSASNINGCFCNETTKLFMMKVSDRLILLVAYCSGIELKGPKSVFFYCDPEVHFQEG